MSDITTTKVIQTNVIPIQYNFVDLNILDGINDYKTFYYKQEAEITGGPGNYTWSIKVIRSKHQDFRDGGTVIGRRDKSSGALLLTNGNRFENRDVGYVEFGLQNVQLDMNRLINEQIDLNNEEKEELDKSTSTLNESTNEITDGSGNVTKIGESVVLTEIDFNGLGNNVNIEGRNFRDGYQDLSYPEGLGSNRQDRVRFEQLYSSGRKIAAGINLTDQIFQRSTQRITGSVTLPIVTGIEDTNQVDWQGASLNPLQAVGASGALDIFQKARDTKGLGAAFRDAAGATQEALGRMRKPDSTVGSDINTAINVYLAQKAVGAQGLLSRTTGAILNPNLEMLFNGPTLRQFPFTFKLSARDADEADQIRKIIRFFKQGMSVKTSSSNVFLKSPNIFRISYQTFNTNGEEILHPSLNIIKDCALLSCNVQYTPDGTYMTYDDPFRTMTSYQLTLAFGELDPIFDDDYTDLDDNNDQVIGY